MPYCPDCGYEYLPSVTVCPDCGRALVAEAPAEEEPVNEPLVSVYEAPDELMSIMVRDLLQEAGISTVVQPGRLPQLFDGLNLSMRVFHSRLLVFESRAEEARRLIAAYLAEIESGAAEQAAEQAEEESEKQ